MANTVPVEALRVCLLSGELRHFPPDPKVCVAWTKQPLPPMGAQASGTLSKPKVLVSIYFE